MGVAVPVRSNGDRIAAMELVTMAVVPGAALALARLNVFEALAQAGDGAQLTAAELAARAVPGKSIDVTNLERLLRMMSGVNVLRETSGTGGEYRYALEPVGRFLVEDPEHGSFLDMLRLLQSSQYLQALDHMHESVLDSSITPHIRAHGMSAWDYFKLHDDRNEIMNKAQAGTSKLTMPDILSTYSGFHDVQVLVDVGGGYGASLGLITAKHPHIQGINFDLPQVIQGAPAVPGVEHVAGNMFESIPSGDAIIMKFILHGWTDENCVKILKKCYEALPAHGKVISIDNVLPEVIDYGGGDPLALQFDINMMVWSDSGREPTASKLRELGLAAGFKEFGVICKVDALTVVEFHKA